MLCAWECGGSGLFCGWGRRFRLRTPLLRGEDEETPLTRWRARDVGVGVCAASEHPPLLVVGGGGGVFLYKGHAISVQKAYYLSISH